MRVISFLELIFWLLVCILVLQGAKIDGLSDKDVETKAYIVYMGERKHSDVELLTKSHHDMLSSALGSKEAAMDSMIYSYRHGFSGFAAKMTKSQAQFIAELPDVIEVFPNRLYKLHTTRSWDFLGLSQYSTSDLLHDSNQGDGVIIGVVDSGIWPESESFKDNGMGPIPAKWKGFCQSGDEFDPAKHCNKKIIGARYFIDGFLAEINEPFNATENQDYLSPRDFEGHGTHCASTAGGSFVSNVSANGLAYGIVRGGAPRARLAIYKVGWVDATYITSADTLKAFDEAIHDGVDILSLSLGSDLPLYPEIDKRDSIYYGSFHAVAHGITVVCSGGNSGPLYQTVEDVAPWITTVAASSMDRSFPIPIVLGNNKKFTGQGVYVGQDTSSLDLVFRETSLLEGSNVDCEQITTNDTWVAGKVVLCFTTTATETDIDNAVDAVQQAGGLGIIATKKTIKASSQYYSPFPIVLVPYDVGTKILNYIRNTRDPKVRIKPSKTYVGKEVSTYIASFSSRGPNSVSPAVLKPDIAAPGVDVLAAYPPKGLYLHGYAFESGTSMAAPHIAGIAALLKSLHPKWSPAAIRSALVTTAWTTDPYSGEPIFARGDIPKIADPFDYGGGLVNPNAAKNPGLVYDIGTQDYVNYLCAMGYSQAAINQLTGRTNSCPKSGNSVLDLNLPSITVPNLKDSITITRTVTNAGDPNSKYEVVVHPPLGIVVKVNPTHLFFNRNITKMSFTVTITTLHKITTEYYFGSLTWTDKMHNVRIPISVRTEFPQVYGN
ncbi:Tripeptidyl-peptidase II [Handroanthus impetiginosus]|uniref:Tripeptidyl-peptidase II n=1 Tax=Handroanthus impetiginosus TaxID=429701 RepID=A0A2G9HZI0_9LAMI|nr:Tripeptidyl-peptidase II [Handroanthus impetiginosus]